MLITIVLFLIMSIQCDSSILQNCTLLPFYGTGISSDGTTLLSDNEIETRYSLKRIFDNSTLLTCAAKDSEIDVGGLEGNQDAIWRQDPPRQAAHRIG